MSSRGWLGLAAAGLVACLLALGSPAASAAPMMVSADIATLPASTIAMITNLEALAISQDPLGRQGVAVARRGQLQVWVKPLAGGSRAVAILNRGADGGSVELSAQLIGLPAGRLTIRDVWAHQTSRVRVIWATLAGDSAMLLRVSG